MILINNLKELQKIIRERIISQTGINGEHVLNAQSLYGANLQKTETPSLLLTFETDDSYIVFDVNNSVSTDDIIEETEDGLVTYVSFTSTIMCYGKNNALNAILIKSRFLTEELITDFHAHGVHIQTIDSQEQVNEFINGKLVTRQDVVMHFACNVETSKLVNFSSFETSEISEVYPCR